MRRGYASFSKGGPAVSEFKKKNRNQREYKTERRKAMVKEDVIHCGTSFAFM